MQVTSYQVPWQSRSYSPSYCTPQTRIAKRWKQPGCSDCQDQQGVFVTSDLDSCKGTPTAFESTKSPAVYLESQKYIDSVIIRVLDYRGIPFSHFCEASRDLLFEDMEADLCLYGYCSFKKTPGYLECTIPFDCVVKLDGNDNDYAQLRNLAEEIWVSVFKSGITVEFGHLVVDIQNREVVPVDDLISCCSL